MKGAIGPLTGKSRRSPSRRGGTRSTIVLLFALAGASLAAAGMDIPASPPPPPVTDAGELQLDYRGDDPYAYEYRDVAVGDVDGVPGLDIVRVGANATSPNANITVSSFSESLGFQNRSGSELAGAYFTRVEIAQLESDPAPEIVVSGRAFNQSNGFLEPAVFVYEAASPIALRANRTLTPKGPAETADFWGVSVGDVDNDGTQEYVAVGTVGYPPAPEYRIRGMVEVGHLTGASLVPEYSNEFSGSWVDYRTVQVAELGGPAGPEVIIGGVRDNRSYLGIARMESGKLEFKANVSFGSTMYGTVESVDAGDLLSVPGIEIATCGWQDVPGASESLATVWQWDGGSGLSQLRARNWTGMHKAAACYDIELLNVSGGPEKEYVSTVGFSYNDTLPNVMLGELMLMTPDLVEIDKLQWTGSDTDHWGMSSGDVDADGQLEIVSVGMKIAGSTVFGESQVVEIPEKGLIAMPAAAMMMLFFLSTGRDLRLRRISPVARVRRAP